MNGVYKFYCIFTCGCVISERALKSMQSNSNKCLNCDKAYDDSDLIILNPNEEDLQLNQDKYNNRKAAAKVSAKIAQKQKAEESASSTETETKSTFKNDASSIPTASATGNSNKRSHAQSEASKKPASLETKRPKSIQDDPNASAVYKSLFTSSEKSKNQQKAHWVTYNPQYF